MMEYLTGRRRYRTVLWNDTKILVLQVEVSRFKPSQKGHLGKWVCSFRDATSDDITKAEEIV